MEQTGQLLSTPKSELLYYFFSLSYSHGAEVGHQNLVLLSFPFERKLNSAWGYIYYHTSPSLHTAAEKSKAAAAAPSGCHCVSFKTQITHTLHLHCLPSTFSAFCLQFHFLCLTTSDRQIGDGVIMFWPTDLALLKACFDDWSVVHCLPTLMLFLDDTD